MSVNRNQFFMAGLVVLLFGLQLRWVESFELNEPATKFIQKRLQKKKAKQAFTNPFVFVANTTGAAPKRQRIVPPRWIGWALVSVGAVLVLHSLAMKKPD